MDQWREETESFERFKHYLEAFRNVEIPQWMQEYEWVMRMAAGTVTMCSVRDHIRILQVFGGVGPVSNTRENHEHRALRHKRQLDLMKTWPELHEALMTGLGLTKFGDETPALKAKREGKEGKRP